MKNSTLWTIGLALASCSSVLTGCSKAPPAEGSSSSLSQTLPSDLFAQKPLADAQSVAEVKANASLTGEVVVHGRVGGRKESFVDGIAMFLLADASMKSCDELHGDSCRTPWDYCCEPAESLSAKIATVQIVDADGKPLRVGIKGQHGLEALARVTVAGKIASRDDGTLLINASRIHVASGDG